MEFTFESTDLSDYLKSNKYIDFYKESIQQKANELFTSLIDEISIIKKHLNMYVMI